MKYRTLTKNELKELEGSFIRFLSANSIPADDWKKMKKNKSSQVSQLINTFSDIVFDGALKKVDFLEYRTTTDLKIFKCLKDKMVLINLTINGITELDLTKSLSSTVLEPFLQSKANFNIYQTEKKYAKERELELFELMEAGCLISKDDKLFKYLSIKGMED